MRTGQQVACTMHQALQAGSPPFGYFEMLLHKVAIQGDHGRSKCATTPNQKAIAESIRRICPGDDLFDVEELAGSILL